MRHAISILFVIVGLGLIGPAVAPAAEFAQTETFGETGPFGGSPADAGHLSRPGGVAVDQTTGEVFIADTGNNRVDVFSAGGEFLRAWGWNVIPPEEQEEPPKEEEPKEELQVCTSETRCQKGLAGRGEGEMNSTQSVAVSPVDGNVYTFNRVDARIQAFEPSGKFLFEFGGFEERNEQGEKIPDRGKLGSGPAEGNDIAIDSTGDVYVSEGFPESGYARVLVYSATGTYERSITNESGIGRTFSASSIAIDSADNLYINDEYAQIDGEFSSRVLVFDAAGNYVRRTAVDLQTHGLAVNPENNHLFVEASVRDAEEKDHYTLYEYDADGRLVDQTPVPGLAFGREEQLFSSPFRGPASFGLAYSSATAEGRAKGTIYATDQNADQALILTSPAPGAPVIKTFGVGGIGASGADLSALINPNSAETTYYFEYGTSSAYGSKTPVLPFSIGASGRTIEVTTHAAGLQSSTTYHYRLVATNPLGTTTSADRTFTTLPPGGAPPAGLPDGRAYELVSPLDKGLNDILESLGQSSSDGDAVAFGSVNGLPGSESGALFNTYVARRTDSGWTTVPASIADTNDAGLLFGTPLMFSRDLSRDVVRTNNVLAGTAPAGEAGDLFLRTNSPISNQLMTPQQQKEGGTTTISAVGASADFSRIFFQANSALTPDAAENGAVYPQLYEWSGAGLKLVSRDASGAPIANGAEAVPIAGIPRPGAVSEDGSRIFFVSPKDTTSPEQLYVRVNGNETQEVSKSVRSTPDPYERPGGVTFQGAAADGSSVFFTSNVELTDDADTGSNQVGEGEFENNDRGANLYRYSGGTLTDLTVNQKANTEKGADVRGVLVAAGGNVAYFGATGVLAPGGTEGAQNLYRWSAGEGVRFVTTIDEEDAFMEGGAPLERVARTTADGGVLVFNSIAPLAGTTETDAAGEVVPEIYRYTPGSGVACVSCGGRGTPVTGAQLAVPLLPGGPINSLSTDGSRVFFGTQDALVAGDVNGTSDVYEWQGGATRLISSGTGSFNSVLIDASPGGNDVFFTTRQRLLASDTDDNVDVYDARVGGGFSIPTPAAACLGEACLPPSASPPARPGLDSSRVSGPGNKKPKQKKHKRRKAKQCKAKAKQGKKRCPRRTKRHSTGKRG